MYVMNSIICVVCTVCIDIPATSDNGFERNADETNAHYLPTGFVTHNSQYYRDAADFFNSMLNLSSYQMPNIQNGASNYISNVLVLLCYLSTIIVM